MLQNLWGTTSRVFGIDVDPKDLTLGQIALRALVIFIVGVLMVRLGNKRFLGRSTAFDALLAVILGSMLGRAINGSGPFFETIGAGFLLVGLHWLLAASAFHSSHFGTLIKGHSRTLVQDGEIEWDAMRKSHISDKDLLEAARINGKLADESRVQSAWLERNGDISVIPRAHEPRVVEVAVEAGVQRVRIELQNGG